MLLLNYVKHLQVTRILFNTYSLRMLLIKPQITKPQNCRIIIGFLSLKFLPKGSYWKKGDVGLLTAASQQQSHQQMCPDPWQLETQAVVSGFLLSYLSTNQ